MATNNYSNSIAEFSEEFNVPEKELKTFVNNMFPFACKEKSEEQKQKDLDNALSRALLVMGVRPHLSGYDYIVHAVKLCLADGSFSTSITTALYPAVAKATNTTAQRVERAIRHSLNCAKRAGNLYKINSLLQAQVVAPGASITNGEFIALVVCYLRSL